MRGQAPTIIGASASLAAALDHISRLAAIDRSVLVIGERGTGKELAAERLHYLSRRWDQTFTKINCGAIAESLLESELFGHEAGAFTGATKQHIGRFELSDGGTLFLDELATMSLRLQEKLLRVIEYGEFERVGGQKTLRVDVRLVAATNADLPALADAGLFRWDLLDRLSFDVVQLPPLRERDDDLYELAQHFSVKMCQELGWPYFPGFSENALAQLGAHSWPGNIRELKNAVERSLFRADDPEKPIETIVIDPFSRAAGPEEATANLEPTAQAELASGQAAVWPISLKSLINVEERQWVERALAETGQRQNEAATLLGVSYNQIRALVKKHRLKPRAARSAASTIADPR